MKRAPRKVNDVLLDIVRGSSKHTTKVFRHDKYVLWEIRTSDSHVHGVLFEPDIVKLAKALQS